jgi:hypothetical protein
MRLEIPRINIEKKRKREIDDNGLYISSEIT